MPIALGIATLVIVGLGIAIFSHPAGAAESLKGRTRGGGGGGGGGTGNGGEDGKKVDETKPPAVAVVLPKLSVLRRGGMTIAPIPTPGQLYRIVEGDTGSRIALQAYDAAKPTATWLKMALHPYNTTKLGGNYSKWFLPQWAADGSTWVGHFTGLYAVIYIPLESEI